MKKLLFTILSITLFNTQSYACLCFNDVIQAYLEMGKEIPPKLALQTTSLNGALNPKIQLLNQTLKKQKEALESENRVQKELILQKQKFIFLLKQRNHLM